MPVLHLYFNPTDHLLTSSRTKGKLNSPLHLAVTNIMTVCRYWQRSNA